MVRACVRACVSPSKKLMPLLLLHCVLVCICLGVSVRACVLARHICCVLVSWQQRRALLQWDKDGVDNQLRAAGRLEESDHFALIGTFIRQLHLFTFFQQGTKAVVADRPESTRT
jgi:hypothetical protein